MSIELKDGSDMTCVRCKQPVKVGVIVCPKCADELGAELRKGVKGR